LQKFSKQVLGTDLLKLRRLGKSVLTGKLFHMLIVCECWGKFALLSQNTAVYPINQSIYNAP